MTGSSAGFLPWREPRPLSDGTFETVYHHPLAEVSAPCWRETHVVNPLELACNEDIGCFSWRPMVWAIDGGGRFRHWPNTSPESVVKGLDGYLFLRDNAAFEQIFEATGLSDENLGRWLEVLRRRQLWCEARGIDYRVLIVPDKHSIYSDRLPGSPPPSPRRPALRIIEAANEQLKKAIVYPLDALKNGRAKFETAYKTDVHWTRYGAFLAYAELMATLPNVSHDRMVREGALKQRTMPFVGDSGRRIDASPEVVVWMDPPPVPGLKAIVRGTRFDRGQVDIFETPEPELPHAVIFRTSNSTHLFPLLMWHFSRLVAVATDRFFYEMIETEKPSVIITEMPERYIVGGPKVFENDPISLPNDTEGQSFSDFTGYTLPLPTDAVD